MKKTISLPVTVAGLLAFGAAGAQDARPNLMIVMVDDMGYSDIGCYGSEISTPTLNKLASNGLRYTQMYNTARSCPTRASLLTGLNPHLANIGWMTDRDLGHDGYQDELSADAVTIAEVMKTAGYSTYMSGKWHVAATKDAYQNGSKHNWPMQRGFDRFFGTINGAGNYWDPYSMKLGNDSVDASQYPGEFFYTDKIADYMIDFVTDHKAGKSKNPFFAYVTFTAPHWPLHARQATVDKYMERYTEGWDALRRERYERMVGMGLIKPDWKLSPRDPDSKPWDSLTADQKRDMTKRMAVYAAMIDEMDQALGRIVAALSKNKQLDNTVIMFLSDNGACAEFISGGPDKSYEGIGTRNSFESYHLEWANASNTPFRMFKHWVHEGGISTPLIVHWPKGVKAKGQYRNDPYCLIDLMATCVDLGKAAYPAEFKGHKIPKMEGKSLALTFSGKPLPERYLFWEHECNCAARKGKWKIVFKANEKYPFVNKWELYDIDNDRSELNDLAAAHPEIVKEMAAAWDQWAMTHKVYPLDGRPHGARIRTPIFKFPEGYLQQERDMILGND